MRDRHHTEKVGSLFSGLWKGKGGQEGDKGEEEREKEGRREREREREGERTEFISLGERWKERVCRLEEYRLRGRVERGWDLSLKGTRSTGDRPGLQMVTITKTHQNYSRKKLQLYLTSLTL